MSIISDWFKGAKKKEVRSPFTVSPYGNFWNNGGQGFFKKDDLLIEYKNWAYACITARAEAVGDIKLKLYSGDKEVMKHEAMDILKRVNPYMTTHDLLQATQSYKDLEGNAFWFLARDGENRDGAIQEIYILRPDRVQIVQDSDNPLLVRGYVYNQTDGKKIPLNPSEVIHHKNFNPLSNHPFPGRGMGVIEAAAWAIDTDNEVRKWNYNFFKNSAKPEGVLEYAGGGSLSPEDYKRIKEGWSQEHQGSENAHKTAILSGGISWKPMTPTQTEMEFSEQRIFSRDEILSLFRVPKTIIGITDDVNRANAEASIYVFNLRTVKPLMQHLVDTLNEFYLPEFGDNLRFEFENPVPEDRTTVLSEYTQGLNKWLSANEIRAKEGLPLTLSGDIMYGPFNELERDTAPKPATKQFATLEQKSDAIKAEVEKIVEAFVKNIPAEAKPGKKNMTPEMKKAYLEIWKANINVNTKPLEKRLVSYFSKQEKETQENLRRELKGLTEKEFKFKGVSDVPFDEEQAIESGINLITPFIQQYITAAGIEAAKLTGEAFIDATKRIEAFIKERASYFAESVNTTTTDKILKQVGEGIDNSETIDQISERIHTVFEEAKTSRTIMIARTEVSASSNFGATEAYQQAGVEKQEWAVVDPEDADCLENDGAIRKIGDAFPDGDIAPPVHPNCVCTLLPVFEDS